MGGHYCLATVQKVDHGSRWILLFTTDGQSSRLIQIFRLLARVEGISGQSLQSLLDAAVVSSHARIDSYWSQRIRERTELRSDSVDTGTSSRLSSAVSLTVATMTSSHHRR